MSEKKCTFEKCNRGQDIIFSVHYKLYTINQNKIAQLEINENIEQIENVEWDCDIK